MGLRGVSLIVVALVVGVGCGEESGPEGVDDGHHHHGPKGPNGGDVVAFADGAAKLEAITDHESGALAVYVLDARDGAIELPKPPVLRMETDGGPVEIVGVKEEGLGLWAFTHEALKGEPDGATVEVLIGGKTHRPELPHHHH